MRPSSTYRLQLHSKFTFRDAMKIVPYLDRLGIATVYCSPIQEAVAGSLHGYDVTDPEVINSEIGTPEDVAAFSAALRAHGISWLQDIVPNHMSYSAANPWLMDVFERGKHSPFFHHFDIDWVSVIDGHVQKVLLPVLSKSLEQSLDEISLRFSDAGFFVVIGDSAFPLSLESLRMIAQRPDVEESSALQLLNYTEQAESIKHTGDWNIFKKKWFESLSAPHRKRIDALFAQLSQSVESRRFVVDHQCYRPVDWRVTSKTINYRRFFTINNLIGVCMEDPITFLRYHRLIKQLYDQKIIQGLRVDHIDGLAEPGNYCRSLRKFFGDDCYIIVEKILSENETLPGDWKIQGTTGYEFLGQINHLFTDPSGEAQLRAFYEKFTGTRYNYKMLVREKKKLILENHMRGEFKNLCAGLDHLHRNDRKKSRKMYEALAAWMISMPVYRSYPDKIPLSAEDETVLKRSFEIAREYDTDLHDDLTYLQALFTTQTDPEGRKFLKRVMQFTGPLTAKGVEDTTFYIYNALISHDEVGESPEKISGSIDHFHRQMLQRQRTFPGSLNATSTHDTKRGEDTRLRLDAICSFPAEWQELLRVFNTEAERLSENAVDTRLDRNDQYLILQSIVGHFPTDLTVTEAWIGRLKAFVEKALREGKVNSSWDDPNPAYEQACAYLIDGILNLDIVASHIIPLIIKLDHIAMINSAAMVLLKITCPGVPDIFQGCELWNHNFVDPDNRRPVDYALCEHMLHTLDAQGENGFRFAVIHRSAGYEKMLVLHRALHYRRTHVQLFEQGDYIAIPVVGGWHIAFARKLNDLWLITICACRTTNEGPSSPSEFKIPCGPNIIFENLFTGERIQTNELPLNADELLKDFPVAMLQGSEKRIK